MLTLEDAETAAGVYSRAARGLNPSRLIDICIIRKSDEDDNYDKELVERIRETTGSRSLVLSPDYGGTLVALSFEEAHLTWKVFKALKRNGHTPLYQRKMRYSLRRLPSWAKRVRAYNTDA